MQAGGALNVERPGGILHLEGGDGVDGMRATEGSSGTSAEADMADFPFGFEGDQLSDGVFDGGFSVNAMDVVQVNVVGA